MTFAPGNMNRRAVAVLTTALLMSPSAWAHADELGRWKIDKSVSPLTNLPIFVASIQSDESLRNSIGAPDRAELVVRCKDGTLAVFVSWVQVLNTDIYTPFSGTPQAMVWRRIDGGPIDYAYWDIASGGTAAGAFDSRKATKFLNQLAGSRRLAIRMSSLQGSQDASFDLSGLDQVAAEARSVCGMQSPTMLPGSPPDFKGGSSSRPIEDGEFGASVAITSLAGVRLDIENLRQRLEQQGFKISNFDEDEQSLSTEPKAWKLTAAQADCGKSIGIPYLKDRRARTWVTASIRKATEGFELRIKITGQYDVVPKPKALVCRSLGSVESDIANAIAAAS